jgi:protocatechuate 3,4-dioxygenase beta subunit
MDIKLEVSMDSAKLVKIVGYIKYPTLLICSLLLLYNLFLTVNLYAQALKPTLPMSEGPYWKSGSPHKAVLYQKGDYGRKITVSGKVLNSAGKVIPGTKIDIWQTDGKGAYDNTGYQFRGHVLADQSGQYRFKTLLPGEYPGRTAHIHIKITTQNGRKLTTQLYFPEKSERNKKDWLFDKNLVVHWKSETQASYNFVLRE